jgi:hypothetical protein
VNRPRLKGLDEMPTPRKTLRQHYFTLKARIAGSRYLIRAWPVLKLVALALIIWILARLVGFPIEKHLHWLLGMLRELA